MIKKRFLLSTSVILISTTFILFFASTVDAARIDGDIWWAEVLHNQADPGYFSPLGTEETHPPATGRRLHYHQSVTLKIRTRENDLSSVWVRVWQENLRDGLPIASGSFRREMTKGALVENYRFWEVTLPAPGITCRMWYRFYLIDDAGVGGYTWDEWNNPRNSPGSAFDIDSYMDDTARDGRAGRMYEYPQTKGEDGAAAAEVLNDFLIIFYREVLQPTPISPPAFVNSVQPTLKWQAVVSPFTVYYDVEVDENSDFSSPLLRENALTTTSLQIPIKLADGKYYWRIRARTEFDTGDWLTGSFTVDTVAPVAATLHTTFPPKTRIGRWWLIGSAEENGVIEVDVNGSIVSGAVGRDGKFRVPITLRRGANTVKLRVVDRAGNPSEFTSPQTVEYIAGWGHENCLTEVRAGVENTFCFRKYGSPLLEIKVRTASTIPFPTIYVEQFFPFEENELDVPPLRGVTVYRYFTVDSNIPKAELKWANFVFRVELDWLKERGLSPEDIQLWRFEGRWVPIETSYVGRDFTHAEYELTAGTDKLSWLAIASKPAPQLLLYLALVVLAAVSGVSGYLFGARKIRLTGRV